MCVIFVEWYLPVPELAMVGILGVIGDRPYVSEATTLILRQDLGHVNM